MARRQQTAGNGNRRAQGNERARARRQTLELTVDPTSGKVEVEKIGVTRVDGVPASHWRPITTTIKVGSRRNVSLVCKLRKELVVELGEGGHHSFELVHRR